MSKASKKVPQRDPGKDAILSQIACRVVSILPTNIDDAELTLERASSILRSLPAFYGQKASGGVR